MDPVPAPGCVCGSHRIADSYDNRYFDAHTVGANPYRHSGRCDCNADAHSGADPAPHASAAADRESGTNRIRRWDTYRNDDGNRDCDGNRNTHADSNCDAGRTGHLCAEE